MIKKHSWRKFLIKAFLQGDTVKARGFGGSLQINEAVLPLSEVSQMAGRRAGTDNLTNSTITRRLAAHDGGQRRSYKTLPSNGAFWLNCTFPAGSICSLPAVSPAGFLAVLPAAGLEESPGSASEALRSCCFLLADPETSSIACLIPGAVLLWHFHESPENLFSRPLPISLC